MTTNDDLSAACDALGKIMLSLQARKLLARGVRNDVIRAKMEADALSDEQLADIAGRGFEAAAMALAKDGHPGATFHECNPTEAP